MKLLRAGQDELDAIVCEALAALSDGRLVVIPTDTVYGLAARGDVEAAVRQVYEAKGRPADRPLPVLVPDSSWLMRYGRDVPDAAVRLAEVFWPGPLTIVVRRSGEIPPWVTAGGETVGLRQPDHPLALAVLRGAHFPVVVTSANVSGEATPQTAQQCAAPLADFVALVIEAGPLTSQPSTVAAVEGSSVRVLRAGPISAEDIRRAVGPEVIVEEADER